MKRPMLILLPAAVVGLTLALRLLVPGRTEAPPDPADEGLETTQLRHTRASGPVRADRSRPRSGPSSSRADETPSTTASQFLSRRELTGYLVDDFRTWTALPPGYRVENIRLAGGGITVEPPSDPEQNRSGVLLSPPLPLRPPPGGRPDRPGRELPPGSSLELEIRLSRDGVHWTGWAMVERYTAPDGPLAPLPPQPDEEGLKAYEDSTTTGPTIQYRLKLTVGSGGAPTIRDLRIWHEGPARLEHALSIHSPPLL